MRWLRKLFGLFRRAPSDAAQPGSGRPLPRGMRNNNPLNIEHNTRNLWRGLADPPSDGRFARFVSMEHGVRAAAVLLRNYQERYNLQTVEDIVRRWAPPFENNVAAYVRSVNRHAGFTPGQKLKLDDDATMVRLIRAMARHECGVDLDEKVARQGVAMVT